MIEFLAVIVILAIIALIATPIILGIINDARVSLQRRSIELYRVSVANSVIGQTLKQTNRKISGEFELYDNLDDPCAEGGCDDDPKAYERDMCELNSGTWSSDSGECQYGDSGYGCDDPDDYDSCMEDGGVWMPECYCSYE